jgi:transcriptional regulator with XRE-family HTH domain
MRYFVKNTRMIDVAGRIKELREGKGLKQVDVAEKLGMERSNYSRLEKRGNDLSVNQIIDIANALGVTPIEILFPVEIEAIRRGGLTIHKQNGELQALREQNAYMLENQRSMKNFFSIFMQMGKGFQDMGLTEEFFKKQLDPDGKLEAWAKDKIQNDMIPAVGKMDFLNEPDKDE